VALESFLIWLINDEKEIPGTTIKGCIIQQMAAKP
jgi:hypothetical protein